MKRANKRKKKGRYRRRSNVQIICQAIIGACAIFILGCAGYALYYTLRPLPEIDAELSEEIEQIAEYYRGQDIAGEGFGENFNQSSVEDYIETETEAETETKTETETETEMKAKTETETKAKTETAAKTETEAETETKTKLEPDSAEAYAEVAFEDGGADGENAFDETERRELINGVSLNPQYPENQNLARTFDSLMPQITDGCVDTYDKVKACYTYLVEKCSYSPTVKYTYEQDAYLLLTEKRGSCTYYAAAFHYMMRYIGLDDKLISSYRILESGESFHRWNEIAIDGIPYVFDTQWEDTLSMDRKIQYVRFFKTYQELEGLYIVK